MSYYTEKLGQVLADPLQKKAYDSPDSTVVIAGPGDGGIIVSSQTKTA